VVAVGCDQPFLTGELLGRLARGREGCVRADGWLDSVNSPEELAAAERA
jgi:hypothetical protein